MAACNNYVIITEISERSIAPHVTILKITEVINLLKKPILNKFLTKLFEYGVFIENCSVNLFKFRQNYVRD